MTVFRNEQEHLRYEISGNNLAIKYFTQQLKKMSFYKDSETGHKIHAGYKKIIELIKLDSKEMEMSYFGGSVNRRA